MSTRSNDNDNNNETLLSLSSSVPINIHITAIQPEVAIWNNRGVDAVTAGEWSMAVTNFTMALQRLQQQQQQQSVFLLSSSSRSVSSSLSSCSQERLPLPLPLEVGPFNERWTMNDHHHDPNYENQSGDKDHEDDDKDNDSDDNNDDNSKHFHWCADPIRIPVLHSMHDASVHLWETTLAAVLYYNLGWTYHRLSASSPASSCGVPLQLQLLLQHNSAWSWWLGQAICLYDKAASLVITPSFSSSCPIRSDLARQVIIACLNNSGVAYYTLQHYHPLRQCMETLSLYLNGTTDHRHDHHHHHNYDHSNHDNPTVTPWTTNPTPTVTPSPNRHQHNEAQQQQQRRMVLNTLLLQAPKLAPAA